MMGEGARGEDSDKNRLLPPPPPATREGLRKCLSLPHPLISRLLSRASRASTFHDIPQKESLVAGYKVRSKTVAVYGVFYNVWRGILKVQKTFSNV